MSDWDENDDGRDAPVVSGGWSGIGRGRVDASHRGGCAGPFKMDRGSQPWQGGDSFQGVGRGMGGPSGGRGCFKCGQSGHLARDCSAPGDNSGGGFSNRPGAGAGGFGPRPDSRACHKCGETGHLARECSQSGRAFSGPMVGNGSADPMSFGRDPHENGGGFGQAASTGYSNMGSAGYRNGSDAVRASGCRKCGEDGHFARECPNGSFASGPGVAGGDALSKGSGCHKCGEEGHFARDCPKSVAQPGRAKVESYIPPEVSEEDVTQSQAGINFDSHFSIPVELSGRDPVKPIASFDEAGLLETLRLNVSRAGYTKPTPVQKYAIPAIMSGRDLMACAQTGSGKTAAFLLPVIAGIVTNGLANSGSSMVELQEPAALVVVPTRELADQIHKEARKFSRDSIVRAVVAYGGVNASYQASQIRNGTNILVATPGRLIDFVSRGVVGLRKVRYLILDEADRMLDMGFMPEVRRLVSELGIPPKTERQTLMFSATFPQDIQQLAQEFLNDYLFLTVGMVGGANQDVQQKILLVDQQDKRDKLVEILNANTGRELTLVFVELKRTCDFLASYLSQNGYPTTSIHGDRLQREREEALVHFKTGKCPILIATSVAARGLDIPKVSHVINYDMPSSIDDYVHRIGRTGRCGNVGRATSFFDPSNNQDLIRALVNVLQSAHQDVPDFLEGAALTSTSSARFNPGRGFASRDARLPRYGGRNFDSGHSDSDVPSFASQPDCPPSSAADESWD